MIHTPTLLYCVFQCYALVTLDAVMTEDFLQTRLLWTQLNQTFNILLKSQLLCFPWLFFCLPHNGSIVSVLHFHASFMVVVKLTWVITVTHDDHHEFLQESDSLIVGCWTFTMAVFEMLSQLDIGSQFLLLFFVMLLFCFLGKAINSGKKKIYCKS